MSVNDVYIYDWSSGLGNSPTDDQTIGTDLAAQIRNIKSVYRLLSKNKVYEDFNLPQTNAPINAQGSSLFGSVIFSFSGDIVSDFQKGRKVICQDSSNGSLIGGAIIAVSYSSSSNVTIVFVAFWRNAWSTAYDVLFLGTDNVAPNSFPQSSIGGTCVLEGSATSCEVNFYTAQNPTNIDSVDEDYTNDTRFVMPTKDYVVHLSPCYKDGNATENCSIVKKVDKDYEKFTFHLYEAPGTVGTAEQKIFFDWYITMPRYNS